MLNDGVSHGKILKFEVYVCLIEIWLCAREKRHPEVRKMDSLGAYITMTMTMGMLSCQYFLSVFKDGYLKMNINLLGVPTSSGYG